MLVLLILRNERRRRGVAASESLDDVGEEALSCLKRSATGPQRCQTVDVTVDGPDLHMLNLVVTDMAASVDFYRHAERASSR